MADLKSGAVKFMDGRNRDWSIRLDTPTMYRFSQETGISLTDMVLKDAKTGRFKLMLAMDHVIDLAWQGVQWNTKAKTLVSKEDFIAGIDGNSFMLLHSAISEALANFFLGNQKEKQAVPASSDNTANPGTGS